MTIGLGHYLSVGAMLFTLGILGIFLNRKNIIVILMSIELILLAVNINLVAFSTFLGDIVGQVFALLVLTVAAANTTSNIRFAIKSYMSRCARSAGVFARCAECKNSTQTARQSESVSSSTCALRRRCSPAT